MLRGKDIISIRDLDKSDIELLLKRADDMYKVLAEGRQLDSFKGKLVSTIFFEPSTRTRLSFQTAVKRLGGEVVNFGSVMEATSLAKGESIADTLRMLDGYVDLLIIRHAMEGSARYAAEICQKPIINGGDGGNQHPTQTLLDLFSIKKMKGKIAGLDVALVGDLKYARTMRSLLYGLSMFGAKITLISPEGLEMNPKVIAEAKQKFNANVTETHNLDLTHADVVYACRIQKERFLDPYEAEKVQKKFRITMDALKGVKEDMVILHPLPKIDEMDPAIDNTKYAKYFEQAYLGVPMRMALMSEVMGL